MRCTLAAAGDLPTMGNMPETYTLGHSRHAVDFMSRRTFESHGMFFSAQLRPGLRVLDCACGPGSITQGIARRISPGEVTGVDFNASQVEHAIGAAAAAGVKNARFVRASCYELPFADGSFDAVFSHALLEHLAEPKRALAEFHRVLAPGGHLGVCTPDWGGFLLAPPSVELTAALEAYVTLQTRNGGDPFIGRKLGQYAAEAGFGEIRMAARFECYESMEFIGEFLAFTLREAGKTSEAATFSRWSRESAGLFAQSWVSAVGRRR